MKKLLLAVSVLLVLSACAQAPVSNPHPLPAELPLPAWCYEEPDYSADSIFFVGVSDYYATQELALQDARRNAVMAVVRGIEEFLTPVHVHVEAHRPSPWEEDAKRELRKRLAAQVAKQVQFVGQALVRRSTPSGVAQVAYVRAKISKESFGRIVQDAETEGGAK